MRLELEAEAARRTSFDGIPRFVTEDGRIMKCDWEMPEEDTGEISGETLEERIQRLIDEQM